jgi:LuxR family maltose regulon positive regulatory protein
VSEILLNTKLYIPPLRPNLVVRPRLTNQFVDGLRLGRKLTLISAPAGFGKTTLITACLQQLRDTYRACWVSLDSSDNDVNRFLTYLIAAIQTIQPDFAHELKATLTTVPSSEPDGLVRAFLNELAALTEPIVVVLDDYHVITDPVIHAALETLVEYLPPTVHMVLTSRADPPLALPRWRVRNQLTDIRADALRFQVDETHSFLQQTMGLDLGETAVSTLESRTEGWVAGLQLAAMSLRGSDNPDTQINSFAGSDRLVTDYLLSEVLAHQSPDMQHFLLHTSILERFNAALCDHLLGQAGSQQMLDTLEQVNLFLVPLDNQRNWYRYHHLFAELLQDRLRRDVAETAVSALHLRAAAWYLAQDNRAAAIQHTLHANGFMEAAKLIADSASHRLWEQNWSSWLRQWGHVLPKSAFQLHPRAALRIASAHLIVGEIKPVQVFLDLVESLIENEKAVSLDVRAEYLVLRAILTRNNQKYQQALALIEQAMPHLPPTDRALHIMANMQMVVNAHELGHLDQAENGIQAVLRHLTPDSDANLSMWFQVQQMHGHLAFARADLTRAEQIYTEGERLANQVEPINPLVGIMYNGLGALHFEWNEVAKADHYYQRSVELGKRTGITDILIEANLGAANIAFHYGDYDRVEAILDELAGFVRPSNLSGIVAVSEAISASFALHMGKLETAVRWANASGYQFTDIPTYQKNGFYRLFIRIRLAECRATGEITTLSNLLLLVEHLITLLQNAGNIFGVIESTLLKSLILHEKGDTAFALDALHTALALAQPGSFIRTFVQHGLPMRNLLSQVSYDDPNYVQRLLKAFPETTPHSTTIPAPTHALTKRELDVLMQLAAGLSNKEIEAKLFISKNTVRTHIKNLYSKLHAENRTQAINKARDLGIL